MARAPANAIDDDLPDGSGEPAGMAVRLVSDAADGRDVPRGSLIIVCREPGFRRAGIEHPAVAVYPIDRFSEADLAALAGEPNLELVAVT